MKARTPFLMICLLHVSFAGAPGNLSGADPSQQESALSEGIDRRVYLMAEEHLKWGRMLKEAGDLELAEAEFLEAVRLNTTESRAWRELGFLALEQGEIDRALSRLDRVTAVDPSDVQAYRAKAEAWRMKGDVDKALTAAGKALVIDPEDPGTLIQKGDILASLDMMSQALEAYEQACLKDANPVKSLERLAPLYARLGSVSRAKRAYEELRRLSVFTPEMALCLSRLFLEELDTDAPPEALVRAFYTDPLRTDPLFGLGEWFLYIGRSDAAEVFFLQSVQRDPGDIDAVMNLAYALFDQGDFAAAYQWYDRLLAQGVEDPDLLYNQGLTCMRLSNFTLAAELLEKAARKAPNLPRTYRLLSKAYHALHLPERAMASVREYLRLDPEAPDADELREYLRSVESELAGDEGKEHGS